MVDMHRHTLSQFWVASSTITPTGADSAFLPALTQVVLKELFMT